MAMAHPSSRMDISCFRCQLPMERSTQRKVWLAIDLRRSTVQMGPEVETSRSWDSFFVGYRSNHSFSACQDCVIRALSQMGLSHVDPRALSLSIYNRARSPSIASTGELVVVVILTLVELVDMPLDEDDDDDDDDIDDEDDDESFLLDEQMGLRAIPATTASIEASLESLNFEQGMTDSESTCPVCLDDSVVGMQLKHMPCMHFFHEHCIVT